MSEQASEQAAYAVIVTGRVQGVAYRYSTQRQALALGLTGWVRNRYDGSVEAYLEGEEGVARQLISWMQTGPAGAKVRSVEAESCAAKGAKGFEIAETAG